MKRAIIIALAGISLTACATAEQVRANGPIETYEVAQTPEQVRDCLVRAHPHMMNVSPMGDGWIVGHSQNPNIATYAEIQPVGEGAVVSVYTMRTNNAFRNIVRRCVSPT